MSRFAEEDPFFSHPLASLFIEKSFEAKESTGNAKISNRARNEIALQFQIEIGLAEALAYLAKNNVEEEIESLDSDLQNIQQSGGAGSE